MAEDVLRFEREISLGELAGILDGSINIAVEKTGATADFQPVEKAYRRLVSDKKTKKTDYDIDLSEALHRQLKQLPWNVKLDMRMWQWMTIIRFPEIVWTRWNGSVPAPDGVAGALARRGMADRFLGNRSLRGRNRNALSRLFFTAEILHDKVDSYKLAAMAFANQDRHTSIFERAMGLVPAAAKALIKVTKGMGSKDIQRAAKRLNHIGSSLVFETVDERELIDLLK